MSNRNMFSGMKSKGGNGKNAEKLFKKYAAHLKDEHGIDVIKEIDEIADNYEEYGFNEDDYNWVRIYVRLQTGFKYPTTDILWATYKRWYLQTKDGTNAELNKITWNKMFSEAAIKFDKSNKGKTASPVYLKKKMQDLIKAASKKSGKVLPNPVSVGSTRISAEEVMNTDDLDWL